MKHNRTLCWMLAFCVGTTVLWHGLGAALRSQSGVTLKNLEGDPAALQGITLTGSFEDCTMKYELAVQDGSIKNEFHAFDYQKYPKKLQGYTTLQMRPSQNGNFQQPQMCDKQEDEYERWEMIGDRVRLVVECVAWEDNYDSYQAMIDTGIDIHIKEGGCKFQNMIVNGAKSGGWQGDVEAYQWAPESWNLFEQNNTCYRTCHKIGGKIYTMVNFPWGGGAIYQLDQMEMHTREDNASEAKELYTVKNQREQALRLDFNMEPTGRVYKIMEFTPQEATRILNIMPLADELLVITQTQKDSDSMQPDENGELQPVQGPEYSSVEGWLCDESGQRIQRLKLLQLQDDQDACVIVSRCLQPQDEDTLTILVDIDSATSQLVQAAIGVRFQNGRVEIVNRVVVPSNALANKLGMTFDGNEIRKLEAAQLSSNGSKMAVVTRTPLRHDAVASQITGGDLYLEVWQNGQRQYLGQLEGGWKQDIMPELVNHGTDINRRYGWELAFPTDSYKWNRSRVQYLDYVVDEKEEWEGSDD